MERGRGAAARPLGDGDGLTGDRDPSGGRSSAFGLRVRAELGWTVVILGLTVALALRYFPAALPERSSAAYWGMALASAALLLGSVLVHELAHAVIAERFGVRSRGITLLLLGARTEMAGTLPNPRADALMAAAGPASNVLLALASAAVLQVTSRAGAELATSVLSFGMLANALLAVINALPVFPLDGGRIVRAMLWVRSGALPVATRQAAFVGVIVSALVAICGVVLFTSGRPMEGVLAFSVGLYLYARARSALRAARR